MILSFVIPVYNVDKYLRRCLESIYLQDVSLNEYEVIIINDGSNDSSDQIVNEYLTSFENIKYISQQNQGLSASRNIGIKYAVGDYIWFVDGDDKIEINCLDSLFNTIKLFSSDIIAFDYWKLFPSGELELVAFKKNIKYPISGIEFLSIYNAGTAWQQIYSRDFLINENLTFKVGMLHEDGEFNIRCKSLARSIYYLGRPIYFYSLGREGSITNHISINNLKDLISYSRNILEFIEQHNFSQYEKKILFTQSCFAFTSSIKLSGLLSNNDEIKYYDLILENRFYILKSCFNSNLVRYMFIGIGLKYVPFIFVKLYKMYVLLRIRK